MGSFASLMTELDERTVASRIGIPHDEARMRYALHTNTVSSFGQFEDVIADYYNYQFSNCVANGGSLSRAEAAGRAKQLLEQEYRRHGGDIVSAFNDARDGTNGGMRMILDRLAEGMKADSVKTHMRDVFDRNVAPNSWEDKVEIIRQFLSRCPVDMRSDLREDQPERYAQNYEELIQSYVTALQKTSSVFRRFSG